MFLAVLLSIVMNLKQFKCASTDEHKNAVYLQACHAFSHLLAIIFKSSDVCVSSGQA